MEKHCRDGQVTIRRMRSACWITKATETHSEYIILTAFLDNDVYANAPLFQYIHTCIVTTGL